MFTIYSDRGTDSTMVSNLFIDEYMKSANDAQIKIYLYLLRMMGARRTTSISDLADQFNHTEKDVVRSLRYWEKKGLLDLTFGSGDDLVSICLRKPGDSSRAGRRGEGACFSRAQTGTDASAPLPAAAAISANASLTVPASTSLTAGSSVFSDSGAACAGVSSDAAVFSEPAGVSSAIGAEAVSAVPIASAVPGTGSVRGSICPGATGLSPRDSGSPKEHVIAFPTTPQKPGPRQEDAAPAACPVAAKKVRPDPEAKAGAEKKAIEGFRADKNRAQLLFAIEQYIGKPLSLSEIRAVWHMSEILRFSDDLIDYLLQYCVDRGKKDFRYISKVADNWAKNGISTPAQAEALSEEIAAKQKAAAASKKAAAAGKAAASAASGSLAAAAACKASKYAGEAASVDAYTLTDAQPALSARGQYASCKKEAAAGFSGGTKRPKSANSFNQFEQNSYDFDALENELLSVAGN